MKEFDDLFNEFFGRANFGKSRFDMDEQTKRMMEFLKSIDSMDSRLKFGSLMDGKMDADLGAPDTIEHSYENGMYFEKKTWHTPNGDIVKMVGSDVPFDEEVKTIIKKTLEEELAEAIENEDYEKAAKLRDKIAEEKKDKNLEN